MRRLLIALALVLCAAVAAPVAAHDNGKRGKHRGKGPEVIQLPTGFQPEGITTGRGSSFYAGSIPTGDIYGGDLRTGEGRIVVDAPEDRSAIGIKIDRRNRIFVAGGTNVEGNTKGIWVYDATTGRDVAAHPLPEAGFINDVVLTKRAAYFTDSLKPKLYKLPIAKGGALGPVQEIPVTGDFAYGPGFNANGIEAAKGGRVLILVKSSTGELFTADPQTGVTRKIDLGGGDVTNGDGLLLKGRTLYVVQNQDNLVTPVKLSRDLTRGRVRESITSAKFQVPTTIARSHGRLYVVNAKFGIDDPDKQPYEVVRVPKR